MKHLCFAMIAIGLLSGCGGGTDAPKTDEELQQIKANTQVLNQIDPANEDYSDLAAFGAAIGDKRIVVLTEALHGPDNPMLLNTRLLKYLHKEKGFDVVLIESGMFDLSRMEEIKQDHKVAYLDSAPGRVFWGWSRSTGGRKMIEYLDQTTNDLRPMRFAGIDYFAGGVSATDDFVPRYENFMQKNNSAALKSAQWPTYRKVLNHIVSFDIANRPQESELKIFNELSATIDAELCNTPYAGEPALKSKSYWCRISKTLQQETLYLWHDDNPEGSATDPWHPPRDIAQAANVQWWLEGPYKGKKAIIWTHTYHGLIASEKNKLGADVVNTASELAKYYPGQIYTSHITETAQANKGSLETYFKTIDHPLYMNYPASSGLQLILNTLSINENGLIPQKPNHFGTSYQTIFSIPTIGVTNIEWEKYPGKSWPQTLDK